MKILNIGLSLLCSASLASAANTEEPTTPVSANAAQSSEAPNSFETFWNQDKILGDMFGARSSLADKGITGRERFKRTLDRLEGEGLVTRNLDSGSRS